MGIEQGSEYFTQISSARDASKNDEANYSDQTDEQVEPPTAQGKRIMSYYSSPVEYFQHLPPHLQYIKNIPFVHGSTFHFPSYEIDLDESIIDSPLGHKLPLQQEAQSTSEQAPTSDE